MRIALLSAPLCAEHSLVLIATGEIMADDKSKTGGADRSRINVNEDYELRDWSKKLGVSPDTLKDAVKTVGDRASAVEAHLKGNKGSDDAGREAKGERS
jgi:hypothetical protein